MTVKTYRPSRTATARLASTWRETRDGLAVEARTYVRHDGGFEATVFARREATGDLLFAEERVPLRCDWPGHPLAQVEALVEQIRADATPQIGDRA